MHRVSLTNADSRTGSLLFNTHSVTNSDNSWTSRETWPAPSSAMDRQTRGTANTITIMWAAGDHLYRMNYQDFVLAHRKTGAEITVAALPTDEKKATAFGLMKIDGSGRIVDFAEKPTGDALHAMRVDTTILGLDAERCAPQEDLPKEGC